MAERTPDLQVVPIVPIERLHEAPERRGVIADLTCDSDGRIDVYVENESLSSSLPVHALKSGESYRLPAFYEFKQYVEDGGLMSYGPNSEKGIGVPRGSSNPVR